MRHLLRYRKLCLAAICLVASARVISTYWVFNHTFDEPGHIACGLEWLKNGTYRIDPTHPPLPRILQAIGPGFFNPPDVYDAGLMQHPGELLYQSESYENALASGRLGNLPFLLLAILSAYLWTRRISDEATALLAALLVSIMPPLLAHAGLTTTDMAIAGTLPLALFALVVWLDTPNPKNATLLGIAAGLAALSKLSFYLFFPLGALMILLLSPSRRNFRPLQCAAAAAIALTMVWAGYFFDLDLILTGIRSLVFHNREGHKAYLLGEIRYSGWWYFFPVVFFFKTPLAFQLSLLLRRAPRQIYIPAACAAAMMIAVLPSHINLGIRHILPLLPLLAILSAWTLRHSPLPVSMVLLAWLTWSSASIHPDYLAYFNEAARGEPERIRADSDLDWGQDTARLGRYLRDNNITEPIGLALYSSANPARHGIARRRFSAGDSIEGWFAISLSDLVMTDTATRRPWAWLADHKPVAIVGRTVRLYRFPPKASSRR